jgi:hypothetical protein
MAKSTMLTELLAQVIYGNALCLQECNKKLMEAMGPETGCPINVEQVSEMVREMGYAMRAIEASERAMHRFLQDAVNRRQGN